jgi:acetylornithine deacetylase/succinyl-diaminopimelate desuccinylase-like protein
VGHPGLIYQLRGMCKVDEALHQPLHSGNSEPVPDPVQILCAMIADLRKPNGALNVPGLYAKVARPSATQLARIRKLPLSEAKFKKDAGMLPGVRLWGERQFSLLERQWTRPALTVIALEARPLGSSNQIIEAARARLSLRTVPGMDAREAGRLIVKKLTTRPPYGVKVTAKVTGTTPWRTTDPEGPAFESARDALKAGFGKEAATMGAGGTIGFVQPFADLLKGAPCILMGVADPHAGPLREREPAPR